MEKFQTKRLALSETDELGNGKKGGRSTTGQKIFNSLAENGKFDSWRDFNPSDWHKDRNVARHSFNFSMRDGDDGTIIIVIWNRSAVQPCVERRMDFSRRHEQPDRERQSSRRPVEIQTREAIYLALAK